MRIQLKKIVIPCCSTYEFLKVEDIVRYEGLQNYTKVFMTNGQFLVSTHNIGFYKSTLGGQGFFCCHKSHLVNEEHIIRYHKDGHLQMSDESLVPVSRRKRQEFIKSIVEKFSISDGKKSKHPVIATLPLQTSKHYQLAGTDGG